MLSILIITAVSCFPASGEGCNDKEMAFIAKCATKFRGDKAKLAREAARLKGLSGKAMRPDQQQWLVNRLNIVKQLVGAGPSCAEGAWRRAATVEAWHDVACSIPRLRAPPSLERLQRADRPFVFARGADADGVSASARMRAALARPELLRACGDVMTSVGSAAELAVGGRGSRVMTLSDYLSSQDSSSNSSSSLYFFDDGAFLSRCSSVGMLYKTPPPFARLIEYAEAPLFLALGGSGSGIPWHQHKAAFNEVLLGAKRWSFYPPRIFTAVADEFGFDPKRPHVDWLSRVYPKLPTTHRPLECVQRPGDVVFVPKDWFHATANVGDTVAVAQQPIRAANPFGF